METTLLLGPNYDWLVVGSNGAVGSELTRALMRSSYIDVRRPVDVLSHPLDSYAEITLDLALRRASSNPLRLLFCAGKGGFSLAQASAYQQYRRFEKFCRLLTPSIGLDKFIFVSSLGAHCSNIESSYSQLIRANEQITQANFGERALILRLPSLYGYNVRVQRYHGLIGVILRNLKNRSPTSIYSRLETRRNYLSIQRLATMLVSCRPGGSLLETYGSLNVQSSINLSVFDVCSAFFRAVKKRPILKLMHHSPVDAEHHCPNAVPGAKVIINDSISEWLIWHWNQCAHLSL